MSFIKRSDTEFALQLENFNSKLPTYAATLDVTPTEMAQSAADSAFFSSVVSAQETIQTYAEAITGYKDLARYGRGDEVLPGFPNMPPFIMPSPPVAAKIEKRFSLLCQRIKASLNYSKTIGEDLGIESTDSIFNPEAGKPVIKTAFSSGGHLVLKWKKGKFQGVEVWKDTGAGWQKLDIDTSPDYTDKSPLPPAGQSATWQYKMIYLYKDAVVGQWSDIVTVTVAGNV